MKELLQNKLAIPLIALAIVGGGAAYTISHSGSSTIFAQTPTAQQAQPQTTAADKPENAADKADVAGADNKQDPSYTSSIKTQDTQEVNDATESQQLASLAKISSDQAKTAAEKSAGGTASSVKLENENGNVVYAVTVGSKDVKVDAGNGAILQTDTTDSGETPNQTEGAN